jgi:predicted metal-dependent HD superfamily phosphohydrolase
MLKQTFIELIANYSKDAALANELWDDIESHYSSKNRFYHTLNHLENLLDQLLEVKTKIKDWNCFCLLCFYHDIIYKATMSNNEEKSADFVEIIMLNLSIPNLIVESCKNQILATKSHLSN